MSFAFLAVIHEFAVIGTTFFIVALATLWYSPLLFGGYVTRYGSTTYGLSEPTEATFWRQLAVVFISYGCSVGLLAYVLAYVPKLGISTITLTVLIALFGIAITAPSTLFEGRSWRLYAVHTGFMVVSVVVAIVSLQYWPW